MNLSEMSVLNLLKLQSSIIDELKRRNVVRTKNNPLGDFTEWLVSKALKLKLASNSSAGYDAVDENGLRIQIKGRRITSENKSRQLSAIRNYEVVDFDYLAAVIFDENYKIIDALLIPHEVIGDYASYRSHVNAHILILKGPILVDPRVQNIKEVLEVIL